MNLKNILLFFVILALTSCALKPTTSEYPFIKTDMQPIELDKLGDGTVLIYNGADILHKMDNTARLNISIDNKSLGQIRPSEYVIIHLENGKHEFNALHIDVVNMRSTHDVDIDPQTKVIKIKPNITSNKLTVTNALPEKFEKFKYAEKR